MTKKKLFLKGMISSFLIAAGIAAQGCGTGGDAERTAFEAITPSYIGSVIEYLASDSLKGRGTPSEGLDSAAAYIAGQFSSFGLRPLNGDYFQALNLAKIELGGENHLIIKSREEEPSRKFEIKDDYVPYEMTANRSADGGIAFAGYGITAPEYNYDDYAGLDVSGKTVVVLKHEPGENDTASVFLGARASRHSEINEKVSNAIAHRAAAIIIITDPLNHSSLMPQGFPWPSLSKFIPKSALPIMIDCPDSMKIPSVQAGEEVANYLFGSVDSLKSMQARIDSGLKPASFILKDKVISLKTSTALVSEELKIRPPKNVIGYIEGSDPVLKNEMVIIGAHYDHIGCKKKYEAGQDYIFNGADDNASGTAGMVSVARAFASLEKKPARSILFIAFAGEELGLFGSQWYVNNPLLPIDNCVAMLNLDMIGRSRNDELTVVGSGLSPVLTEITRTQNEVTGFKLKYEDDFLGRSDQANFMKKGIPVIYYTTGEHGDYHKVTDEYKLIETEKTAGVARLAFLVVNKISGEAMHYKTTKTN